jgi:hypothetical protein
MKAYKILATTPEASSTFSTALYLIAMSLAVVSFSSCGSKTTDRKSSASVASSGGAECTSFNSTSTRLQGRVTTYYQNGQLQEDMLRLRLTDIVADFDTSPSIYVKLYRWKADHTTGVVEIDPKALSFRVEKTSGDTSVAISQPMDSINNVTAAQLRSANGITGSTSADFFNNTVLVPSGADYAWDAIKVVVYNGSTVVGSADMLAPIFSASPNTYASNHPGVLRELHPFWSSRAQQLGDVEWATRSKTFCF